MFRDQLYSISKLETVPASDFNFFASINTNNTGREDPCPPPASAQGKSGGWCLDIRPIRTVDVVGDENADAVLT